MKQLTSIEIEKAAMLKALRSAIRLKHSLLADAELAAKLPELEERINASLAGGRALELTVGSIFDEA
jgi:hypothetical protein